MLNPALHKIAVIGISGTGKSTVSREIAETTNLPLYHMDSIIWGELSDCHASLLWMKSYILLRKRLPDITARYPTGRREL